MKACHKLTARIHRDPGVIYCKKCKFTAMERNSILQNKCYYCGAALDKNKPTFDAVPKIDQKGQIKLI